MVSPKNDEPRPSQKSVINVYQNINHGSADSSYKTKFVNMTKQACFKFTMLPLKYKSNTYDHNQILKKIELRLFDLQNFLSRQGCYDEYYKSHQGRLLYIRPMLDIVTQSNIERFGYAES